MQTPRQPAPLGVVIVTYNSVDVITDCLESLLMADSDVELHIVVVDNASNDGTLQHIRDWATGAAGAAGAAGDIGATPLSQSANWPFPVRERPEPVMLRTADDPGAGITLIEAGINGGFAAGVNLGLQFLAGSPEIDRFWILNPDCLVPPQTPGVLANCPVPSDGFSLIGGRIRYLDPPHRIESDGAYVSLTTGVTGNFNLGGDVETAQPPKAEDLDFVCGASMVASRHFYETVGPLPEEYFLYYEEVAWALRRGNLPLVSCPEALIYHHAGTAIGSPTIKKIASPFSIYFLYRSRMIFIRSCNPKSLPVTYLYASAKAVQMILKGYREEAFALLRAINGLRPPANVQNVLSPETLKRIFG